MLEGNPRAPFAPEAVALPDDGTVSDAGGTVTLDGSSSDGGPWGTNVTYGWALPDPASGVTIDDDTSVTPEATIPALTADTELTFTLTVTGRGGENGIAPGTDTATVRVTRADNTAPTAADSSVTIDEDTAHPFAATEFNFADTDPGDALVSVTVVTLPAAGALTLDGTAVTAGRVVPAADIGKLTFTPAANGNGLGYASFTFRVSDGTDESASAYPMTVNVTAVNDPATGKPEISGTPQVGQPLTADVSGIMDADGLTNVSYTYQWYGETQGLSAQISGATLSTYTPVTLDVGKTIKVEVSFTDDAGNAEAPLTSDATATVAVPTAPGVTVSTTALTVTEQDSTGDSYTVVLDTEPTANVVVTVAGHAGTDVTPNPTTLTFTSTIWSTAQTVTVTAGDDADTTDDTVALTHSAASADSGYSGIAIPSVAVTVSDNDTARVTGLTVTPGNARLVTNWTAVDNATGYKVQWKSGGQNYNTGSRQSTVTSGSTTSHTITGLANGTEYTVRVSATRTGANDGPASAEETGTPAVPTAPGVTVSTTALTVTEQDSTGDSYTVVLDTEPTANVVVTVAGHAGTDVTPNPTTLTFTSTIWSTAQTVTVTAGDDADTTDDSVALTHSAASADSGYSGIAIAGVAVTVSDNDTAGICQRTPAVIAAILNKISSVSDCANVTDTHLAAITGGLPLSNRNVTALAAGDFAGLGALTTLRLHDNALTTLPDGVFAGLDALTTLRLHDNALTTLPDGVFAPLTALTTLNLYNNALPTLPDGVFAGLDALTTLSLSNSGLATLPAGVFAPLTALTWLSLSDNDLTALPAGVFVPLTALTKLRLHNNALTALPAGVFAGLNTLTTLWLNDNALTALPAGVFAGLDMLTTLWLDDNALTALPDDVFEPLTALTELKLANNSGGPFGPDAVALPDDGTVSNAGGTVTLDGSGSNGGAWGTNVTYGWALTNPASGVAVTFDDDTSVTPKVTVTSLPEDTELTFTLTVTGRGGTNGIRRGTDTATVTATASPASDDATLESLTVSDGTSDLTLAPPFAPGTFVYAADVANAVTMVTLTAETTDDGASVSAVTLAGTAIADNDFTDGIMVPSLLVGDNAIMVRVTAEDTSTTRTYEVTVTRATPPGVTVSTTALTVTEQDTTGDSYTVVLDTQPTADVTVTVAGHAGTDVTPDPGTLTFTTSNWDTAQTVTVTAGDDADTTDDSVTLTHSAASTDTGYSGITIAGVTVTVRDNDTAQVTGLTVTSGNAQLVVNWAAVDNATGYKVQWKSGGQGYNGSRQFTVTSGSTTSHTITGLANGTEYTVRVSATRTGANDGPASAEKTGTPAVPTAPGVTVSKTALTVTEQDSTGGSYTVALDTEPTANVTVTVAGHAGTDVTPDPATLTFTASNWSTAQTVTVTAGDDADTTDDTVALTHSAASADSGYSGIAIPSVAVTVSDNDTARVTGLTVTPGNAQLAVNWTAVDNATGYKVQWKSGSQGYNTGNRQSTVTSGSTTSHTITGLANGTEYTVQVSATRTGANDGPASAEKTGTPAVPTAPGVTVSKTALTVTEQDSTGGSYTVVLDTEPTANVVVTVAGHSGTDVTANPTTLTFTASNWSTVQTVTVTAGDDADTTDDTVALTHSAASADTGYSGIAIAGVALTVRDNDTAQVTGLTVTSGNAQLVVNWAAVDNATGYKVQWKSGGEGYNRQPAVHGHLRFDHEPHDHGPRQRHRVHGAGERDADRRQRRPAVGGGDGHAGRADRAGGHGVDDGADGDGAGLDRGQLHGGAGYRADGGCDGDGRRARGHGRDPDPGLPDVHGPGLEHGADGNGDRGRRCGHHGRFGHADPQRGEHGQRLRRHRDRRGGGDGERQRHRAGDGRIGRRAAGGELDGGGQRHGLQGAVEVGRPGLQHRQPAVHGHLRFDHEPHDHGPGQRHRIHGAGERDPDRRQRRPAVGGGAGHADGQHLHQHGAADADRRGGAGHGERGRAGELPHRDVEADAGGRGRDRLPLRGRVRAQRAVENDHGHQFARERPVLGGRARYAGRCGVRGRRRVHGPASAGRRLHAGHAVVGDGEDTRQRRPRGPADVAAAGGMAGRRQGPGGSGRGTGVLGEARPGAGGDGDGGLGNARRQREGRGGLRGGLGDAGFRPRRDGEDGQRRRARRRPRRGTGGDAAGAAERAGRGHRRRRGEGDDREQRPHADGVARAIRARGVGPRGGGGRRPLARRAAGLAPDPRRAPGRTTVRIERARRTGRAEHNG